MYLHLRIVQVVIKMHGGESLFLHDTFSYDFYSKISLLNGAEKLWYHSRFTERPLTGKAAVAIKSAEFEQALPEDMVYGTQTGLFYSKQGVHPSLAAEKLWYHWERESLSPLTGKAAITSAELEQFDRYMNVIVIVVFILAPLAWVVRWAVRLKKKSTKKTLKNKMSKFEKMIYEEVVDEFRELGIFKDLNWLQRELIQRSKWKFKQETDQLLKALKREVIRVEGAENYWERRWRTVLTKFKDGGGLERELERFRKHEHRQSELMKERIVEELVNDELRNMLWNFMNTQREMEFLQLEEKRSKENKDHDAILKRKKAQNAERKRVEKEKKHQEFLNKLRKAMGMAEGAAEGIVNDPNVSDLRKYITEGHQMKHTEVHEELRKAKSLLERLQQGK